MNACLHCGSKFEPRHPSQKFCPKTAAGRHLCKDRYHNNARAASGTLSQLRREYLEEKARKNEPDVWGMIVAKTSRRLQMIDDVPWDGVPTKNGVEVDRGFVGITDQEHEDAMDSMGDDF